MRGGEREKGEGDRERREREREKGRREGGREREDNALYLAPTQAEPLFIDERTSND